MKTELKRVKALVMVVAAIMALCIARAEVHVEARSAVVTVDTTFVEGADVESPVSIAYGNVDSLGCTLSADGDELLSPTGSGVYRLYPTSLGEHTLVWSFENVAMTTKVTVVRLKVPAPVITPGNGTIIGSPQPMVISCEVNEAQIYYTIDDSEPTTASPPYAPFAISGKTTVKAVACRNGLYSAVVTNEYALGQCADPTISPKDGTVFEYGGQVVSIVQNVEEGVVHYTTDGTDPTPTSSIYTEPFKVEVSTTVKAKVFSNRYFDSAVVTVRLTFDDLAAAKTAAKLAIDAALGENPSAAAKVLADAAKQAIDAAETVADVTTAKEAGVADIAEQIAAEELAAAKTNAKTAIDAALGENPSAAAQALADAAKQAIDAAETVADVTTAQETGVANIMKQIAADELAAAKTDAKAAIDAALGENPSAAAQALADAAKQAIDAATTVADVTTAKESGVADIAEQITAEELAAAKTAAKQAIDDALLGANPSDTALALADAAKQAIDAAETVADVTTAQEAGVAEVEKQLAADELAAAKEAAKQAIDAALGENPSAAAQALADAAKQAIDAATTVTDVTTAQESGVADIAKQIAADELAAAKTDAKAAIDAALGENPSAAAQALADAAKQVIDAAETVADVTTAKESGVANVAEQRRAEKLGLVTFEETDLVVDEGSSIIVRIKGGNSDWASGVQVVVAYNTAAAVDLDLKNATTNGVAVKSFKFPVTLNWAKGEIGEKTIEIPVAVDQAVEADEVLMLQLANPMNATIAGAESGAQGLSALPGLCTVTIHDPQYDVLKAKVAAGEATKAETDALVKADKVFAGKVYVRGLANDATRGRVTGSALAAIGKTVTLKATANKGWVFAGWYEGSAADGHAGRVTLPVSRETSLKVVASNAVTYVAQFITPNEDKLELGEFLPAEFSVGTPVSIEVPVASVSLPTVTVSGLPAGLKYTAKDVVDSRTKQVTARANTIYGTPTKATAKPVTVTVTAKNLGGYVITRKYEVSVVTTASAPTSFAKVVSDAAPYHAVSVEVNDDFAGKVTGAGVVQAGKKVTLKATANKGYVFSGWYDGNDTADGHAGRVTLPVSQAASYGFVMPSNDVALVARFVTVAEDAASIATGLNGLALDGAAFETNVMAGVSLAWPVAAEALSLPTVKVTGLPAGLKFTAKDVVDSKTKQVAVPANTIYGAPTAASKPDKYGIVSPSQVKITVTTAGKAKRDYYLALTVDAMPVWAVGTFNGSAFAADAVTPNGLATLTIAATGKVSGKLLADGLTWSLAAPSFTDYAPDAGFTAPLIGTSGKLAFTNELAVAADTLGGLARGERFAAAQNNWKVEPWKSRAATFGKVPAVTVLVGGDQTVTLKFAASGAVTAAGEFVTGVDAKGNKVVVKATCSTVVTPEEMPDESGAFAASVYVYFPPKGGFAGYSARIRLHWNGTSFVAE